MVETDDAGIIQRWYTVPIEDGVRKGKARPTGPVRTPSSLHSTLHNRRPEISRSVSTNKTEQKRMRLKGKRKRPPIFPPFLVFPWPFNWILYASTPIFMPVFMIGVVIAFIIDSGRSRRRARPMDGDQPLNETIATAVSLASRRGDNLFASSSAFSPYFVSDRAWSFQSTGPMETVGRILDSAARTMSNTLIRRTTGFDPELGSDESDSEMQVALDTRSSSTSNSAEQSRRSSSAQSSQTDMSTTSTLVNESPVRGDDGIGSVLNNIRHWPRDNGVNQSRQPDPRSNKQHIRPPSSRMHSMVAESSEYKTSYDDKPYPHPAHDPLASPHRADLTGKKDVKLELTDVQRRIIRNLNEGARCKKWLTWFPMVRNAHAAISVRYVCSCTRSSCKGALIIPQLISDGRKFPEQEQGRGVVRRWAENTVMHENRKA